MQIQPFSVLLLCLYIYTCGSHKQSVGFKINSASSFSQYFGTLWLRVTLTSHSYGNAGLLEKQNSGKKNTITMSSHFPRSADQSWQCCLWSMRGHLPRREVCLDTGTCCQPDVICLMLCRYCDYNDRISCRRFPLKQQRSGGKRCQESKVKRWSSKRVECPVGKKKNCMLQ